jgi:hypothetical protein
MRERQSLNLCLTHPSDFYRKVDQHPEIRLFVW